MGEKEEREEHPADFHSLEGACQLAARVRLFRISKAVGYYPALHKD